MPLLRIDVIEGRSEEELKELLDAIHSAMHAAFTRVKSCAKRCRRSRILEAYLERLGRNLASFGCAMLVDAAGRAAAKDTIEVGSRIL